MSEMSEQARTDPHTSGDTRGIARIPLDIVVTATGATTKGVLVAVMANELDDLERRAEGTPDGDHDYLVGLECGHTWPGTAESDTRAKEILDLFMATGDTHHCRRCGAQKRITGPVSRVL